MVKIGIVGNGFSGAMTAYHLLRQTSIPAEVYLVGELDSPGQGLGFKSKDPVHVLNVPASKMSALPEDPEHFLRWCRNKGREFFGTKDVGPGDFLPRWVYGRYVSELLDEVQKHQVNQHSSVQKQLKLIQGTCIDVLSTKTKKELLIHDGRQISVDFVVLAVSNFVRTCTELPLAAEFVTDPWSPDAFLGLDPKKRVLFVGSGLTMVDTALALVSRGHVGPMLSISRHGLIPKSHALGVVPQDCMKNFTNPQHLSSLLRDFRTCLRRQDGDWRSLMDGLRPHTQFLWKGLPLTEKKRFLRHLSPHWEVHRHRLAPEIAREFAELITQKRLKVLAGRLEKLSPIHEKGVLQIQWRSSSQKMQEGLKLGDAFDFKVTDTSSHKIKAQIEVDKIFDCTGYKPRDLGKRGDLWSKLLQRGYVTADPTGIGFKTDSIGKTITSHGEVPPWLFVVGSLRSGGIWESTAVPELRVQSQKVAEQIILEQKFAAISVL